MRELSGIVAAERCLEVLHPATQGPAGLVLILLPPPQVKAAAREPINDHINNHINNRGKVTAEQVEGNRIAMLAASLGGREWQSDLNFQGEKPGSATRPCGSC